MYSPDIEQDLRVAIFRWLDERQLGGQYEFTRDELANFHVGDIRIPLIDRGRGIRNPRDFESTLSIMTSVNSPYSDRLDTAAFVKYDYRAGENRDNFKLKRAFQHQAPLIYFEGIRPGVFVAHYPVYVVADDPIDRVFTITMDESLRFFGDPAALPPDLRAYAERTVKARLHQPAFRAKVMHAYASTCAICSLKHLELLDAAHIIPDVERDGFADVTNGLSLCKIHHAAYDRNLLGITPDYVVRINGELLDEVDGPMLRYGLQDMHGKTLTLPGRAIDRPARVALARRYEDFAA
ncbi:restriction endonuclease [Cryobacterium sp. TMT2-18-3]|uniref:HNH endonuclease n=1 Tax=unclassified Cryobacterium TaxID=2649013 RepID=UPI00106AD973|nr:MULTISPECIES: HNH endonuclease [unclassified Cryobacterium]TFC26755.1 restriction endonuclease [Cryobacterium sp. TMT2-18-2]TFC68752.1 restriction endonuclease [Cryobacterium sp. TMT2-18-3]